jgi:transposase
MHKILSAEDRLHLLSRHRRERDGRVRDRIKSVLLYDEGWSFSQIAKALFIDEDTAKRYVEAYTVDGSLEPKHKGSTTLLNAENSKLLSDHLEATTYLKVKEIRVYVQETFGCDLKQTTMYDWLKTHNFTYKKPKLTPKNANPDKQLEFVKSYENIMIEASLEGDPVLFGDSVHPTQEVRVTYGWIKRGKDKIIETTGARKRLNIMGALNLETMKFDYQDFETINSSSAIQFLKQLEQAYPTAKKIHLIWDQAGYHTSQEVGEFLETSRIKVHFLPPRSPNLNPIEGLWKVMHEYVSNNKVYEKFKDFKRSLFNFFNNTIPTIIDELVRRITDNFHILHHSK